MSTAIKATLTNNGQTLRLEVPILPAPKETEKMQLVASSGGFQDLDLKLGDRVVRVNVMAGYRK